MLVSFQNQVSLFCGKGSPTKKSVFYALPTARDWEGEDGMSGDKHDLERALSSINKYLQSYGDGYLGDDHHEARALADKCLIQSLLFVYTLSEFRLRTYSTLMLSSSYRAKTGTLLMRQMKKVWEDVVWARACCFKPTDPRKIGLGMFQSHDAVSRWEVLKAHAVMREYVMHNFEDHPSIAAEKVRWVTRNAMSIQR
jgi:hypothetical protein